LAICTNDGESSFNSLKYHPLFWRNEKPIVMSMHIWKTEGNAHIHFKALLTGYQDFVKKKYHMVYNKEV